jgi:ABC-type Fe3+-hydroxamate transport system substrate-binding protein
LQKIVHQSQNFSFKLSDNFSIVSLVPSLTQLLFFLGLEKQVVGITKFCVHPIHWRKSKTIVGGTKNVNFKKIKSLNPTIIIANKEENNKEDIELLSQDYFVYVSNVYDFESCFTMIQNIGVIINSQSKANKLISDLQQEIKMFVPLNRSISALYAIWLEPFMVAGNDTFIHSTMKLLGLENCIAQNRYPVINTDTLLMLKPQVLLLSSEPFPFKQKHINEFQKLLPTSKILLVDGELFSWYGSQLLKTFSYFTELKNQIE